MHAFNACMHYEGTIHRQHVQSSAVRSVGYDAGNWVLQVKFANGKVYNYFRVPPEEYARVMDAASIGSYVNQQVKPYYAAREVETAHA
jgi:hypothetical protein